MNIKFSVPQGWEVQKKQGYGVFIVERFSDLLFPDDSDTSTPVLGPPYLQFAVGNHKAFGVQDMATAKTATDAMLAWFGGERLQNLDPVFGTRFETATTTRPRPEHNVVRTNYLMLLGPDRFATLLVQAPPDQIDNIKNAIALPLIRSLDHIIAPTKAVVPTETPTPVVSATFEMPTVFDTHQSPQIGVDIDFPKGWSSFESDQSVIFASDQHNMDVNNIDSSPYIVVFKRKKAELRNYRPEYSIVDIFRENLGALSKNPQEITGVPFPTAIGRSLGDSTLTLNGWLILVMLDEDNYLEFFAQSPRASEEAFRDEVLIPMLKSLKLN